MATRRSERGGTSGGGGLPFQFQVPLTGGAPGLALPIGGAGSPFAFTVPLGGTPAPQPAATPTPGPTPAPAGTAAQPGAATPPASATDAPVTVAGDIPLYRTAIRRRHDGSAARRSRRR